MRSLLTSLKVGEMDSLLGQLQNLLSHETGFYESMLAVMQKEKAAVMRSELNALNNAIREKEDLILKLRTLEQDRVLVVRRLAEIFGNVPQDLTLTMIAQQIDEPYAGQMRQSCMNLVSLLERVQAENHRNKILIEHSMDLLRGSFDLLSGLMGSNTVYRRTGSVQSTQRIGRLVQGDI
jgi:flagellar biosynthesis/type III secretory pathway chaperone